MKFDFFISVADRIVKDYRKPLCDVQEALKQNFTKRINAICN